MNNLFNISSTQIKAFIISFIAIFLMVALPYLGFKTSGIVSPLPKHSDIFDKILPKLEQKYNDFELKKPTSLISDTSAASEYDELEAYGVINFENGEVILSKKLSEKLPIASLTKIMTAVVVLDLVQPDEKFTVSESATSAIPTRLAFTAGDKLSVEELLNGLLLTSANDCAQIIQEGIDKKFNEPVFVKAMNEKAKFLKLKNTKFQNPAGFDSEDNYSSIEDLTILAHYTLSNYPLISQIVAKESGEILSTPDHQKYEYLNNWNGLVNVYPGVSGVKIGNTGWAKHTTVVASERDGKRLIAVSLGAPNVLKRDLWASKLLDDGFNKTWGLAPIELTEEQLRAKYATWKYNN